MVGCKKTNDKVIEGGGNQNEKKENTCLVSLYSDDLWSGTGGRGSGKGGRIGKTTGVDTAGNTGSLGF